MRFNPAHPHPPPLSPLQPFPFCSHSLNIEPLPASRDRMVQHPVVPRRRKIISLPDGRRQHAPPHRGRTPSPSRSSRVLARRS
ncbi:hypothetical protein FIBSPDRAFT_356876 [Athelia psychrophila]|uniref:Uncharacterized protein n=1 Tax=Athelia psychrophila TaxID=1759441 RepID=A0A166PHM2_9AGAM|nr:hypothetical protein FIBSPDRAFT_356876 [Fibularhizoctonia sp. CBS 109695]